MDVFSFLKFIPKPALLILPLATGFLAFVIFTILKKSKKTAEPKDGIQPTTALADASKETPPAKKSSFQNLLLILTILLLVLSLPLAILLVKQKKDIRMKAAENEVENLAPTSSPNEIITSSTQQCDNIQIYQGDENWLPIEQEGLSNLQVGEIIRIAVKGDLDTFDKGRIRINSMEWTSENETTTQKPDSLGEFYIECEVGIAEEKATICGINANPDESFKFEAELHDKNNGQWR